LAADSTIAWNTSDSEFGESFGRTLHGEMRTMMKKMKIKDAIIEYSMTYSGRSHTFRKLQNNEVVGDRALYLAVIDGQGLEWYGHSWVKDHYQMLSTFGTLFVACNTLDEVLNAQDILYMEPLVTYVSCSNQL
jgi:hypothetical protein